ncbi:hypothetical protein GE061_004421 [Apolygus lucorum]|uniref:Uncharacterized protein n=1 Tax=Apolygus lucorum TaxID=248454 RepID=A0A8S9X348_APOLU|nr:hypothetical protein GE061_004421 [Apolygus lucorum]
MNRTYISRSTHLMILSRHHPRIQWFFRDFSNNRYEDSYQGNNQGAERKKPPCREHAKQPFSRFTTNTTSNNESEEASESKGVVKK